jgi:Tol biopolymer transport system component
MKPFFQPVRLLLPMMALLFVAACRPNEQAQSLLVTLVVDGRERALPQTLAITVGEVLRQAQVELGPQDEVNPPQFTQITDGMRITVARISEETECDEVDVPYEERRIPYEALPPGETRLQQPGQNGIQQVCYRVTVRDGVRSDPVQISSVPLEEPQDAIIYYGPSGELDPVTIEGMLAYVSNNNIWLIRGSSTDGKRQITDTNDIDQRVFSITPDGQQIIYTRQTRGDPSVFNQLWLISDTTRATQPLALVPENVLAAEWIPGSANRVSYSTGEAVAETPGFRAYNDLFEMEINPQTGEPIDVRPLVNPTSSLLYAWWPTRFTWSADGSALACVHADSVGLVDLATGDCQPLVTFPVFETRQAWSWRSTISFSPDGSLLLTTVHGQPIGNEAPQTSPAFHVAVVDKNGAFSANIVENAGIWSTPRYSPAVTDPATGQQRGYIAYLRARDLASSINNSGQYDLIIADRDGSNARVLYPPAGQSGLTTTANATFTWSPDGTQIAFVYQGNLWAIDVASGVAHQLTLDGGASSPVWTR